MQEHAIKYSKAYKSDKENNTSYSFWTTKFDDMAFKTMIRQLYLVGELCLLNCKQQSKEIWQIIEENENYEYVDNEEPIVPITPATEKPVQQQDPADNAVDQFFNNRNGIYAMYICNLEKEKTYWGLFGKF